MSRGGDTPVSYSLKVGSSVPNSFQLLPEFVIAERSGVVSTRVTVELPIVVSVRVVTTVSTVDRIDTLVTIGITVVTVTGCMVVLGVAVTTGETRVLGV